MRNEPIDVCIIEDDPDERALLALRLRGTHLRCVEAADAETGLALIRDHRPCVVICDEFLPGIDGIELCRRIRADGALDGTYVIIVTASSDPEVKTAALNTGADDLLTKPYDEQELKARLRNGLRVGRLQERLRQAALTDGLTGLWNHAYFRELLDREFARTRRYGGGLALLMLDLDHFKAVNDTFGHETGNLVLAAVARHLTNMVRDTDIVARYGGEEFAVISPATRLDEAAQLAERIRATLPDRVQVPRLPDLRVTASIGVSATDDVAVRSVRDLVDRADHALYCAKRQGRNRVMRSDTPDAAPHSFGIERVEVDRLQKQVVSLSLQAKDLCLQSVWALVQALEARDPYTAWHSRNTKYYAMELAEAAGWPEPLRTAVANAAMLHDIGKIGVPDRILQSTHVLTEDQTAVLRQVPLLTCKILEPLRVFETETTIIRHLRERFDGTGYPFGLSGTTIPVGSRLLAVAEAFDALTAERPYRSSRDIDAAVAVIRGEAGRQFDPQFTELLARVAAARRPVWAARIRQALEGFHRRLAAASDGVPTLPSEGAGGRSAR